MEDKCIINIPYPPRCQVPANAAQTRAEEALIITNDGRTHTGEIIEFLESVDYLVFKPVHAAEAIEIGYSDIKRVELTVSRQFQLADEFVEEHGGQLNMPTERQEFEIEFHDNTTEMGETLGHVTDANGLHLFIAQAFYNYHHLFVPFSSIKNKRIGGFIGKMLVDKKMVTSEQLEEVLEEQNKIRNQKLGEYLTAKDVVTAEQLEKALKRQQETPNLRLGEALIQEELISEEQLSNALDAQKTDRSKPLGEILVEKGWVTEVDIKKTLASKLGIPFVNLRKFVIEQSIIKRVPEKICKRHHIIPLYILDDKLIVASENPMNKTPLEDIRFHTKMFVEPVMAAREDIDWAINQNYGFQLDSIAKELDADLAPTPELTENEVSESDNAIVKMVNKMVLDAFESGVSDIHIEPYPGQKKTMVRFRKDGTLMPYVELPPSHRNALVSRIKIMAALDISERRKPQDGKIDFKKYGKADLELRVATIPTAGGTEDVVMRILANGEPIPLNQMEMSDATYQRILSTVVKPYGLFLVCGPTGSGKTTTLHSILGHINTDERKIWTAEDPVEITQAGLRQVQVLPKIGFTFANAMRAFLRADPDVIMVGEMRDKETTQTAVEASLTGHMVFSTLHTNSAPESIVRLLDMGMDPFNFADALLGVLAQRLAKRLCSVCKQEHQLNEFEIDELLAEYHSDFITMDIDKEKTQAEMNKTKTRWLDKYGTNGKITIYKSVGCSECGETGYDGRIALHELLVTSHAVKELIQLRAPVSKLFETAFNEGMKTLKQDGIEKIFHGQTDLRQVHAVCSR